MWVAVFLGGVSGGFQVGVLMFPMKLSIRWRLCSFIGDMVPEIKVIRPDRLPFVFYRKVGDMFLVGQELERLLRLEMESSVKESVPDFHPFRERIQHVLLSLI